MPPRGLPLLGRRLAGGPVICVRHSYSDQTRDKHRYACRCAGDDRVRGGAHQGHIHTRKSIPFGPAITISIAGRPHSGPLAAQGWAGSDDHSAIRHLRGLIVLVFMPAPGAGRTRHHASARACASVPCPGHEPPLLCPASSYAPPGYPVAHLRRASTPTPRVRHASAAARQRGGSGGGGFR